MNFVSSYKLFTSIGLAILILAMVMGSLILADGDTELPNVVSLDFEPKTVDTTLSSQTVTFTARFTDNLSGLDFADVRFRSPSGNQTSYLRFNQPGDLISGDMLDGVYVSTMNLPQYAEAGIWKQDLFLLRDNVGNDIYLTQNQINDLGFPVELVLGVLIYPNIENTLIYSSAQKLTTTTIQIPVGSVTDTTLLAYTNVQTVTTPPTDYGFAGQAFNLDAYRNDTLLSGFNFNIPVTITIDYAYSDVFGIDEETLILAYWDDNAWVDINTSCPLSKYERNPNTNQVSTTICHLSQFALFGVPQPLIYLPIVVASPQPSSDLEVIITLPDGNSYPKSGQVKVIYTIRDTDGVTSFVWGLFTQNLTPLNGGEVLCHNTPECIYEETINLSSITGTFIIGVDAVDFTGQIEREIAEIYVY